MSWIYRGGAVLAAICLVLIAALTLAQIIGRMVGSMVIDAGDVAGYAMAASIFLATAYALREGSHIRVNLLLAHLPEPMRRWMELWCLLAFSVLGVLLCYSTVSFVYDSYRFGDVSTGMVTIPLWIPQVPMALGLILLELALIEELWRVIRGKAPSYQGKDAEGAVSRVD